MGVWVFLLHCCVLLWPAHPFCACSVHWLASIQRHFRHPADLKTRGLNNQAYRYTSNVGEFIIIWMLALFWGKVSRCYNVWWAGHSHLEVDRSGDSKRWVVKIGLVDVAHPNEQHPCRGATAVTIWYRPAVHERLLGASWNIKCGGHVEASREQLQADKGKLWWERLGKWYKRRVCATTSGEYQRWVGHGSSDGPHGRRCGSQ